MGVGGGVQANGNHQQHQHKHGENPSRPDDSHSQGDVFPNVSAATFPQSFGSVRTVRFGFVGFPTARSRISDSRWMRCADNMLLMLADIKR